MSFGSRRKPICSRRKPILFLTTRLDCPLELPAGFPQYWVSLRSAPPHAQGPETRLDGPSHPQHSSYLEGVAGVVMNVRVKARTQPGDLPSTSTTNNKQEYPLKAPCVYRFPQGSPVRVWLDIHAEGSIVHLGSLGVRNGEGNCRATGGQSAPSNMSPWQPLSKFMRYIFLNCPRCGYMGKMQG